MAEKLSRRKFLRATAATVGLPYFVPAQALAMAGRSGANDRLTLAVIGCGGMAQGHIGNLLKFRQLGEVNIAAVCDVDSDRLAKAVEKTAPGAKPYKDYRRILERKDIDAVLIATPDHWHAVQTVDACQAGKHVFVEKPSSVTVEEGRAMVAAAARHRRVIQVGSQSRCARPAYEACRYIRNGMLGKVKRVTCWHGMPPSNNPVIPDTPAPANIDWDMWLGPMRWRPHNTSYYHGTFRQIMDSGGGMIRDRGAHVFSLIRWCLEMDARHPESIEASGTPPVSGIFDCPVEMRVIYKFKDPDLEIIWEQPGQRHTNYPDKNKDFGLVFWGEKDNLIVDRDGTRYEAAEKARVFEIPFGGVNPQHIDRFDDYNMNHKQDWFEAIKTGRKPIMDIEAGHGAAVMCILGNLSYLLGRKLHWDGSAQRFVNDEYADRLLAKPQRYPYVLL